MEEKEQKTSAAKTIVDGIIFLITLALTIIFIVNIFEVKNFKEINSCMKRHVSQIHDDASYDYFLSYCREQAEK